MRVVGLEGLRARIGTSPHFRRSRAARDQNENALASHKERKQGRSVVLNRPVIRAAVRTVDRKSLGPDCSFPDKSPACHAVTDLGDHVAAGEAERARRVVLINQVETGAISDPGFIDSHGIRPDWCLDGQLKRHFGLSKPGDPHPSWVCPGFLTRKERTAMLTGRSLCNRPFFKALTTPRHTLQGCVVLIRMGLRRDPDNQVGP